MSEDRSKLFEGILRESILEGMRNVLGEGGMRAILFRLNFEYARSLSRFHQRLDGIFGPGAVTLERAIVKEVCSKLGLQHRETEPFDFVRCCEILKQIWTTTKVAVWG